MITKNIHQGQYRPEIDGLRALAIVAVIINHFNKELLPSGYLGVDIFFVISGYVITSSLARRKSKNFWDFLVGFYERRVKRLIPALALCVTVTSIIIHLFIQNGGTYYLTGALSLIGISNIYIFSNVGDYWGYDASLNPFTNTWSLGVEEQFYLLFPFIIWFSGIRKDKKKGIYKFLILLSSLTIFSLISFIYFSKINQSAAYYLIPNRFWEIAIGSLTCVIFSKNISLKKQLEKIKPSIIVAGIISLMFLPITTTLIATILTVLLTAILIVCLKKETFIFNLFSHPRVVYIGLLSYSLYLWHWSILALARWSIGISKTTIIPLILLIVLVSIASYENLEKKARSSHWAQNRLTTIIKGFVLSIGVSIFSILLGTVFREKYYLGENKSQNPPQNVFPQSNYHIFGDSHANDIFNLLKNNGTYKVNNYTLPGCRFYFQKSSKCKKHINNTSRILNNVKPRDIVIIASNYLPYLEKEFQSESLAMIKFLNKVVPVLHYKGAKVVLKLPHPSVNPPKVETGLICKKEIFRPKINQKCFVEGVSKKEYIIKREKVINPILKEIKASHPDIFFWNIDNITCPESNCFPVTNNNQYLIDSEHLFLSSANLSDALVKDLNLLIKNNIDN